MADISKITIESGTYDIKDVHARELIYDNNKLYLGAFFNQYDSNRIIISISKDTKNWQDLIKTEMYGRDPSIMYKDGYFYIAITHTSSDHDFRIYKTNDFVNYTTHDVDLHFESSYSRWAPEFFIDTDNTVKVLLNVQETENGLFKNYIADLNLSTYTATNIENITPDGSLSTIDAHLLYDNNIYYLTVADQTTAGTSKVKVYMSYTIGNWQVMNSDVFKTFYYVEGTCTIKDGNKFLIYADSPLMNPYLLIETNDLGTTDSPGQARDEIQDIGTLWDHRHGTIIKVDNSTERAIIDDIIEDKGININFIENPPHMNQVLIINDEDFDNIYIEKNTILYVNGNGGNIGKIWNPFRVKEFEICFYANIGAHLTIDYIQNVEGNTITVNHNYENTNDINLKVFTQNCERTCSPPIGLD